MQAEEGTSMAKMVVMILLVILIIAAVVGLVYAAYNWFTRGSDKLAGQISSIDKASMSQYDNQKVPGSTVLSALKSYADSDIGVFVCTTNIQGVTGNSNAYEATKDGAAKTTANYCALALNNGKTEPETVTANGHNYYKAVISYAADNTINNVPTGCWYAESIYWGSGNAIQHNTDFSVTTDRSASATYVKSSSDFYSNLVYDKSTGDICGICFTQMN